MILCFVLMVCVGLVITQEVPYDAIGCFKDEQQERALPVLVANFRSSIDWHDLSKVVRMCAAETRVRGFDVFAIQYYGECWSGPNAELTYDMYGPIPDGCYDYTVGKIWTNFVYTLT